MPSLDGRTLAVRDTERIVQLSAVEKTTGAELWLSLEQSGTLTRTSLILPPGVSEEEVEAIGRLFGNVKTFTSFALGDLLVYANDNYGEDFCVAVMEETGMAFQTCSNMLSVCRRVRPSVRREELGFHHHAVVAPLPPNDQRHFLAEAVKNQWTRQQLRDAIYGEKVLPPAVSENLPQIVQDALSGAKELMDGWWISRDSYVRLRSAVEGDE